MRIRHGIHRDGLHNQQTQGPEFQHRMALPVARSLTHNKDGKPSVLDPRSVCFPEPGYVFASVDVYLLWPFDIKPACCW